MKSLKHINKYFYKYRVRLLLGIVFVAISNIFAVNSVKYVGSAVDFLREVSLIENKSDAQTQLLHYGAMVIGLAIVSGFFLFLTRQTIIVVSRLIEYDLKNEIYQHYQQLDTSFYKRNNTGDLMNRISEDVSRVRMYIGPAIMYIVSTIITFGLTIVEMIKIDLKLTVYALSPLPILAVSIYYVSNSINKKSTQVQEELSDITTQAQEAFSGIRVLKAYGREKHSEKSFEKHSLNYRKRTLELVRIESLFQPFMILMIGLSTIFTIYIGGLQEIAGKTSYGDITQFIIYINRLTWPIASLGWVTSLIQRAAVSQQRINEFLHTKTDIENSSTDTTDLKAEVSFEQVSFTYPDSGIEALKDISFHIKPGTSMAIIGKTGSGKSTIANLICRLYDTSAGEIRIDNKNIRELNLFSLREKIGYVPQEVFLFSDTIGHNIGFSVDVEKQEQPRIEAAAKQADIYHNIMDFPERFDTVIGERGITLSGGQKQRISIARALIKKPQLLILDDCLSAVDTETEEEILYNVREQMQGKTTIIISHRVSSVKNADFILVLDKGKIVEQGNHAALLQKKGVYYEIHRLQLLDREIS